MLKALNTVRSVTPLPMEGESKRTFRVESHGVLLGKGALGLTRKKALRVGMYQHHSEGYKDRLSTQCQISCFLIQLPIFGTVPGLVSHSLIRKSYLAFNKFPGSFQEYNSVVL